MSDFLEVKSYPLVAGAPLQLAMQANFFQLFQAPTAVDVEFFSKGTSIGKATAAPEGFRRGPVKPGAEWDTVKVTSTVNQTVQICLAFGEASLQRIVGNITATISKAATLSEVADQVIVAGAAAAQIVASNGNRRTVAVKALAANTQPVRIGAAPAAGQGYELNPGESVFLDVTAAVKAWTAAGANQTVTVTEVAD